MQDEAQSNAPELTVAELSNALKRTIEDRFGYVRVRGEISNYRGPHSSGHCYFCLKDQSARIDAVIWKGTFARLRTRPQEGLEVIATGKVTTYPGKSAYQIVIEALEPAGIGALMALLEERRRKLAAEGLFDAARKQLLPFLPRVIGVVTSPMGAVIRDILHRLDERFPCHVLVWPVRVQGETSAEEVAAAIRGLNALPEQGPLRRPDVIIVARGGGSLEDLWSFSEEIVVRAAAESLVPLVAAVGHETDWTLIDYAADLRAPTPTAAAEKAVPVRSELLAEVADLGRRHAGAMFRHLERHRAGLRALARALPQGEALVALPRQRLDTASGRLAGTIAKAQDRRRIGLAGLAHRLSRQSPHARLAKVGERLGALERRLQLAFSTAQARRMQRLAHAGERLASARSTYAQLARERVASARHRLHSLSGRLAHGASQRLTMGRTRLIALEQRLGLGFSTVQVRRRQTLAHSGERLASARSTYAQLARERVASARHRLHSLSGRLAHGIARCLTVERRRVASLGQVLGTLGYRQVLARGFALVRGEDGRPIRLAASIADGTTLDLEFSDGHTAAIAGPSRKSATRKPGSKAPRKREQTSLF